MMTGSIPALVTPFQNGGLDEQGFQDFVDWQIRQGSHGLLPTGTTGESPTLSHPEHDRVVELCVEAAAGRVPVIAGTGSNNTDEAIRLTRHAKEAGADAALIVTPYYNKPTQEGLFRHFKAVLEAVDIPVYIYNIPGRSVIDMSVETMARLARFDNIVGVKDATGKVERVTEQLLACGSDFVQLSGEDASALGFNVHGGRGCISVTANVAPNLCAEMQSACLAGDYATAKTITDRLMPLHKALFCEANPAPTKYALSLLGKCAEEVRLPLAPLSEAGRATVEAAMRKVGLLD
jgi:4-hydroxy-tetrahydrodipicolinate synthase